MHALVTSICQIEYPAICLQCGLILDSSGKGQCSKHILKCNGECGAFFLLQDCNIVLLHFEKGCYFPSPYVDSHGEKHKHMRGKPLYLDENRMTMLAKLWHSNGIPNEVCHKRSTSNRVIIQGHY